MLYNYSFDVSSVIALIFLLLVYSLRRNYRTKSNKILLALIWVNLLSSAFDIASCFAISFPERMPMALNYITTQGYLYFYNVMGLLFYAYIDSRTKIEALWTPNKIIIIGMTVFEGILIFTSPFTHLVSYFDENNVYRHGPLMLMLYIIAGLVLLASAVMFFVRRKRFNRYQVVAIISFVAAVFCGVLIQIFWPRLLVGSFCCTLVMFFLYTSLENPVYYTYRGTTCFNRLSFLETIKRKLRKQEDISFLAFRIRDYDSLRGNLSLKDLERATCNIAEFIRLHYNESAFCIADDKFIVLVDKEEEMAVAQTRLQQYFLKPMQLVDTTTLISAHFAEVKHVDHTLKIDMIENTITYLLEHYESDWGNVEEKENVFSDVAEKINRQKAISTILKEAIENNSFDVFYQPIRNTSNGKFTSVEALIRLNISEYGFISPEEFIPIAEKEGMIYQIGELVFEKVCKFIKDSNCITELGVHYIEINLSPLQCFQVDIVKKFSQIMKKYEVNPHWINLEITETASFEKNDKMTNNINDFHNMGISFSLDDYGSGFASQDYLFKLPVDIVKIDKGILWQAMKDSNARIVLISTLQMLKNLGKSIVVEGVEDEEMVALLTENGCHYMQGYFYSKPIPAEQYVEFLKKHL